MRNQPNQPTQKTMRFLLAAEGYLELNLPERAISSLEKIEEAGELEPYKNFLLGQALRQLDRYDDAIEALQEAARTIPAPLNQKAWEDLSDCFRHQGLDELADITEMFADDPEGGADQNFCEPENAWEFDSETESDTDWDSDWESDREYEEDWAADSEEDPWNRGLIADLEDFSVFNFEEEAEPMEFRLENEKTLPATNPKRPKK